MKNHIYKMLALLSLRSAQKFHDTYIRKVGQNRSIFDFYNKIIVIEYNIIKKACST